MDSLSCNWHYALNIWLKSDWFNSFCPDSRQTAQLAQNVKKIDYSVDLKRSLLNTWRKLVGVLLCKPEHIHASASVGIASKINDKCWSLNTGLRLQLHAVRNRSCLPVYELWRARLGCVPLEVSFAGFHSVCCLICCTDRTVMLNGGCLVFAQLCIAGNSRRGERFTPVTLESTRKIKNLVKLAAREYHFVFV